MSNENNRCVDNNKEQNIQETIGISPTIADEKAMSQKVSPYRTIETLADYIIKLTGKV